MCFSCVDIDPCKSSPCENNGTCKTVNGSQYSCECTSGFTGHDCSIGKITFCVLHWFWLQLHFTQYNIRTSTVCSMPPYRVAYSTVVCRTKAPRKGADKSPHFLCEQDGEAYSLIGNVTGKHLFPPLLFANISVTVRACKISVWLLSVLSRKKNSIAWIREVFIPIKCKKNLPVYNTV